MFYLFREGMALRRHHIESLAKLYPETYEVLPYLEKGTGYLYRLPKEHRTKGKDSSKQDILLFRDSCPDLYKMYIDNPKKKIRKEHIEKYSNEDIARALYSGYLKHDSRGYYFEKR